MSDRFEDYLREHLRREGSAIARAPESLTARIRSSLRSERRLLTQLASVGALLVVAAIGAAVVFELRSNQPSPRVGPAAVTPCAQRSGGTPGQAVRLKGIMVSGSRIEIEFESLSTDAPPSFPAYEVIPQASAHFATGPGREPRILPGSSGLKVVFPDERGAENQWVKIYGENYGQGLISGVEVLPDRVGGLGIGVGLSSPACFTVRELPNPPTLVLNLIADSTPSTPH
jgi:hypothetical protein